MDLQSEHGLIIGKKQQESVFFEVRKSTTAIMSMGYFSPVLSIGVLIELTARKV